jgi:hypothetical protein
VFNEALGELVWGLFNSAVDLLGSPHPFKILENVIQEIILLKIKTNYEITKFSIRLKVLLENENPHSK